MQDNGWLKFVFQGKALKHKFEYLPDYSILKRIYEVLNKYIITYRFIMVTEVTNKCAIMAKEIL